MSSKDFFSFDFQAWAACLRKMEGKSSLPLMVPKRAVIKQLGLVRAAMQCSEQSSTVTDCWKRNHNHNGIHARVRGHQSFHEENCCIMRS